VRIHTEQHSVLNGLKDSGYAGIDNSFKVRHLLKGIKTTDLDVCKTQVMASPTLRGDFDATVELYSTFIKKMKAENPQPNVLEVSFACGKGVNNSFVKRGSSGISNVSNAAGDYRFFEKQYHALTPEQKNTLRLKRLKCGHVGNGDGGCGGGNGNGKGNGKGPTLKSFNRSIAALATKFDKFNFPNDDDDATVRQTFQLLQCAWDVLAEFKKETDHTLTHMQTGVFVGRRFWYSMILTGR
jgi:hypothetical protein